MGVTVGSTLSCHGAYFKGKSEAVIEAALFVATKTTIQASTELTMATTMGANSSCHTIKAKSEAVMEAAVSAAREESMAAATGIVI
jgi:hypothetical protein